MTSMSRTVAQRALVAPGVGWVVFGCESRGEIVYGSALADLGGNFDVLWMKSSDLMMVEEDW